jgi:hypothetical protein
MAGLFVLSHTEFLDERATVRLIFTNRDPVDCLIEPTQLYELVVGALNKLPEHLREAAISAVKEKKNPAAEGVASLNGRRSSAGRGI